MRVLYLLLVIFPFRFISVCAENNVCSTYKDYNTIHENLNCWHDIAVDYSTPKIITHYGYPVEIHKAETPDGYILTLFRIPNYEFHEKKKAPVFLQHGLLQSSSSFLGLGKQSLPFLLADAGYDVWLGNFRGTEYSEEHKNLTVHSKQYWEYTLDHLGLYDIPTQLGLIVDKTGERGNIIFISYSMGSTLSYMYASTFPKEAKTTVKLFISMAPTISLKHTKSLFYKFLPLYSQKFMKFVEQNDLIRIVSQSSTTRKIAKHLCLESPILMQRCLKILNFFIFGPSQIQPNTLPVFFSQAFAGISFKVLNQINDLVLGKFKRNNYGFDNIKIYGRIFPPSYSISKINVPIFLIYSFGDWLVTKKDVLLLYYNLPKKAKIYGKYEVEVPFFSHGDYLYGKNATTLVYDAILNLLEKTSLY